MDSLSLIVKPIGNIGVFLIPVLVVCRQLRMVLAGKVASLRFLSFVVLIDYLKRHDWIGDDVKLFLPLLCVG